ncbi:MAG: hypothetical protein MUC96_14075 [Myxococcaceae bacterium]|jgi:hypothetical protein|nr:hypothetical protein [Myxococcaceae bacterium]
MRRHLALAASVLCLARCGPPAEPELSLLSDRSVFDGRFERAIIRVIATQPDGSSGTGVVQLTAGVGSFVEGEQVALVNGEGSVTFRCDPSEDPACAGQVRLGASWSGVSRALTVRVTPSDPTARPRWSVVPTLQPVTLHAAAKAPDGTVWAVGDRGLLLPFRNNAWGAPVDLGVTATLRALHIGADGVLDLAGDDGTLISGRPTALGRVQHSHGPVAFTGVTRLNGVLFVVTADGRAGPWDVDLVLAELSTRPFAGIAAGADQVVAFAGDSLFTWNGTRFEALAPPIPATWRQARFDTDGLWVLGKREAPSNAPVLVQGPGPEWKSATLPPGEVRAMAWGLGSTDRYVVTDDSVFQQQQGIGWRDLEAPSGGTAIVSLDGTRVLVVGPPGISLLRVR